MKTAGDIMRTELLYLSPRQTLLEALTLFADRKISGAPVVDEQHTLLGVISQTTINTYLTRSRGLLTDQVEDAMTPYAFTSAARATIAELLETMVPTGIHRVIVIDDSRKPIGIVTSLDLVEDFLHFLNR